MPMTVHKIRPGENLTVIAGQYGFGSDWRPIWQYNTVVKRTLNAANKDSIPAGASIVIPRTTKEYDDTIKTLQHLLIEVGRDTAKSLRELDGYKAEADRVGAAVDIAADIAFAAKGAVKASVKLGPRYAKYIMRKEAMTAVLSAVEKVSGLDNSHEGLIIKNAGTATVDQAVMIQARRTFDAQKGRNGFAGGMAKSMGKQAAVISAKAVAPAEMANGVGEIVDVLCDVAIAAGKGAMNAVEAIAPSKVAMGFVWFMSGEHPHDTNERVKKFVATTGQKSAERLRKTITSLQQEKKSVYVSR